MEGGWVCGCYSRGQGGVGGAGPCHMGACCIGLGGGMGAWGGAVGVGVYNRGVWVEGRGKV